MSFFNFLKWEESSKDTIDLKKIYIDMSGDVMAGIFLSQLVYWYLPDDKGRSKLRVKKGNDFWVAKTQAEWYEEIRFSRRNIDTAVKKLEEKKLIIKKSFLFNKKHTSHFRLNIPEFVAAWQKELSGVSEVMAAMEGPEKEFFDYLSEQENGPKNVSEDPENVSELSEPAETLEMYETGISKKCTKRTGGMYESYVSITENTTEITKHDDDDKRKQVSPLKLTLEEISIIENEIKQEYQEMNPRSYRSVCNNVQAAHKAGKVTISYEGYLRSALNKRMDEIEARRVKEAAAKQQPERAYTRKNRSTRKEIVPEWAEEQKRQQQEEQKNSNDATQEELEEQRRQLMEELKIYQK